MFCEFLGFAVWQLWSVTVVLLLLIPTAALAVALSTPHTPVWVLFAVAVVQFLGYRRPGSMLARANV